MGKRTVQTAILVFVILKATDTIQASWWWMYGPALILLILVLIRMARQIYTHWKIKQFLKNLK